MDDLTLKNLRALEGLAKRQQEQIEKLIADNEHARHQVTQLRNELTELTQQFNVYRAMSVGTGPTAG